jgi:hypothetical protein
LGNDAPRFRLPWLRWPTRSRAPRPLLKPVFFASDDESLALTERSLFCLALAFLSKFGFDQPILTWVMFIAAIVYLVRAIVFGISNQ